MLDKDCNLHENYDGIEIEEQDLDVFQHTAKCVTQIVSPEILCL